ncbi:MAG: NUDIX domain-containing protein [Candidatus Heimdallarchaeota archaeon]
MKQFYVGVGAIVEKDNTFLILKRSPKKDVSPNKWEVVTGRLEIDEDPKDGALREITEEAQISAELVMPVGTGFFYRGSKEFPMAFVVFWFRYLTGDVQLSWEHTEYKWATLEEALEIDDLKYFHNELKTIGVLKKHLPADFTIEKYG